MGKKSLFERIIWAIDPFSEEAIRTQAVEALRALTRGTAAFIEPVYVLNPTQLNIATEFFYDFKGHYEDAATRALKQALSGVELPGLVTPQVLDCSGGSMREATRILLDHAAKAGADVIVLSTHSARGLERMLLGSFAETIALTSRIPLLVVNPKSSVSKGIERVMVACDFDEAARGAFDKIVDFTLEHRASMVIVHALPAPVDLITPALPELSSFIEKESKRVRELGETWAERARKRGVSARVLVEQGMQAPSAAARQAAEREEASVVAVLGKSGALSSALLGSTTRRLLRESEKPVLVLHVSK